MPAGAQTRHTYLHRARLNGRHCLVENATLKLLIKAEQSPEGARAMHSAGESQKQGGRKKLSEALKKGDTHLVLLWEGELERGNI